MTTVQKVKKIALGVAVLAGGVGLLAGPASAGGPAQRQTVDATGAVFGCDGGLAFTITGGTVTFSISDSFDATGAEHVTGTTIPSHVTASSNIPGDTSVYRIVGASWFGGNFSAAQQTGVFTSTDHFQILAPSGGPVANVSDVIHMNRDGTVISHDFGNCTTPQGP
jgi:hypothetical protein